MNFTSYDYMIMWKNLTSFRLAAIFLPYKFSDNANISLYPFGDEIYALGEPDTFYKLNTDDLSTGRKITNSEYLAVLHNTSHPHVMQDGKLVKVKIPTRIIGNMPVFFHVYNCADILSNCSKKIIKTIISHRML